MITNEYTLQSKIVEILLSKGYPELSINPEWRQAELHYDLAIVDPNTAELLAVFEFKIESPVVSTSTKLREKIEKYFAIKIKAGVQLFIVTGIQGVSNFRIDRILNSTKETDRPHFIEVKDLPDYSSLRNLVLVEKKKGYIDSFIIVTRLIAFFSFALLILDWTHSLQVTPMRLSLIGIIIGCLLIPHATRLKFLGFEFEKIPNPK
jgi:hypothetical protein